MAGDSLKLAVLIDGDNISAERMAEVFASVERIGRAEIRNVYGSRSSSQSWIEAGKRHALSGRRRHLYVTGHNATDIELVIDAMDLMVWDRVEGFCLVSSDSDFTSLAIRLREGGKLVFGFGEKKAPDSWRNACDSFHVIGDKPKSAPVPAPRAAAVSSPRKQATQILRKAHSACAGNDGWASLSRAGKQIRVDIPAFLPKDYDAPSLKKLIEKCRVFEIGNVCNQMVFRPARAAHSLHLVKA